MTATLDILQDMARGAGPRQALLALGYAGWGPGQLEGEIQANGWLTAPADAELVFGRATRTSGGGAALDLDRPAAAVGRGRAGLNAGARSQPSGQTRAAVGAGRRRGARRSLIARPRPWRGIGATAMPAAPRAAASASAARRWAKRLAAASARSPAGERLRPAAVVAGPKPSQTSPGPAPAASSRSARARGVVRGELARGGDAGGGVARRAARPSARLDRLDRQAAGAQQHRRRRRRSRRSSIRGRPGRRRRRAPRRCGRRGRRGRAPRVVGLTAPEGLAEGAASGPPKAASRRRASGCAGTRSATVGRPAVASVGEAGVGAARQHQRQRARPEAAASARGLGREARRARSAAARSATWTISGLNAGRPLAAKMRGDRAIVAGVGAEAVDRLGREGDELARARAARRRRGGRGRCRRA